MNRVLTIAIAILVFSCQKEISPSIIQQPASVDTPAVLKQVIVRNTSVADPVDFIFSIQYDTLNRKINMYLDDTTNANPFDQLACSYEFNAGGYLIRSNSLDGGGNMAPDFIINRNASNQISEIVEFGAEDVGGVLYNDTIKYEYSSSAGQSIVKDSVRYHNGQTGSFVTNFNTSFQPVVSRNYFIGYLVNTTKFNYNTQSRLSSITRNADTAQFSYDNTPIDSGWQNLPALFLGKDHYLLQLDPLTQRLGYNFLSLIMESKFETVFNPLFTFPLMTINRSGIPVSLGTYQTQAIHFTNTFTANGRLSTIVVTTPGEASFYYYFRYL
jgi:hypothetical protein